MDTRAKGCFNAFLRRHIVPLLKRHGFEGEGTSFVRECDDIHWVINVQTGRWNNVDEFEFTLNVGVYVPGLMRIFLDRKEPARIGIEACAIISRIGLLTEEKLDTWWNITKDNKWKPLTDIALEIEELLKSKGLPFLERFRNKEAVATFLATKRNKDDIQIAPQSAAYSLTYAAIIFKLLSLEERSRNCIAKAIDLSRGSPAEETVRAIAARL